MSEHEPCTGKSDDWYTPPEYFTAFGCRFGTDPCSPGPGHWVPADRIYTIADDGLKQPWSGLVFMNMPFGGRFGHVPWLARFFDHGNGIGIVRAYTSSSWWHEWMPKADMILFPLGKTRFIPSAANLARLQEEAAASGRKWNNAPGHGVAIFAKGAEACQILERCGLGMIWDRRIYQTQGFREP